MTPDTSLTLEGFLRGLHAEMAALIGSIIFISVIYFLVRWFINKSLTTGGMQENDATLVRGWTNSIAGVVMVLVLVGFGFKAASYAVNTVPRTTLDATSIYKDMDRNIDRTATH